MQFRGLLGIVVILFFCWLISSNRKSVNLKQILLGIVVQLSIAAVIFKVAFIKYIFVYITGFVHVIQRATQAGTSFVFGEFGSSTTSSFIFAFQALPLLLVISALSSLLFYWQIIPFIINLMSVFFKRLFDIGGALSFGACANIFLGFDAAALTIKPQLSRLTKSELFSLLTVSLATVSGTVMVLYASILENVITDVIGHIIAASIINVPGALTISRIIVPNNEPSTDGSYDRSLLPNSAMDAISKGTSDAINLVLQIAGMIIVLLAFVHMANELLSYIPTETQLSLQAILGWLISPVMWLIGIPVDQLQPAGSLVGTKVVLNEVMAFIQLSELPANTLSLKAETIMLYTLCGFANIASVGILIAVFSSLVPSRRTEVIKYGILALAAATFTSMVTGAVVSIYV